jgi:putative Mn2+ efflux pump MntP
VTGRHVFRLAFHFGLFQALMPVIGWAAGSAVYQYIAAADHWVAFTLLSFVGGRMIWNAAHKGEEEKTLKDPTSGWTLVLLSIATSIDALAVGLSLAMIGSEIIVPAIIIGLVAAAFTCAGMFLGRRVSALWGRRVEVLGGITLVAIGIKIVIEHLSV